MRAEFYYYPVISFVWEWDFKMVFIFFYLYIFLLAFIKCFLE